MLQPEVVPNDLANFRIGKSLNEIHIQRNA